MANFDVKVIDTIISKGYKAYVREGDKYRLLTKIELESMKEDREFLDDLKKKSALQKRGEELGIILHVGRQVSNPCVSPSSLVNLNWVTLAEVPIVASKKDGNWFYTLAGTPLTDVSDFVRIFLKPFEVKTENGYRDGFFVTSKLEGTKSFGTDKEAAIAYFEEYIQKR
jgi:hypothetical protein